MKEIILNILDNIFDKYCIKCQKYEKCYGYEKPEYCWFCKKSDMNNKLISIDNKIETEYVISQFVKVHRDKYNYNYFNYIDNITVSSIYCKEHGFFQQTPKCHKRGMNCTECSKKIKNIKNTLHNKNCKTINELVTSEIEKAKEIHNNKYNYTLVKFIYGIWPKVSIICPIHGIYEKNIYHHNNKKAGCQKCSKIININSSKLTKENIVERCSKIFNNYYTYDKLFNDNNVNYKVIITCPIHGDFEQKLDSHLKGNGCSRCSLYGVSKLSNTIIEFLTKYYETDIQYYGNQGEYKIPNTNYKADGYIEKTNTIIEIHGTFFHGDLRVYSPTFYNKKLNITMGELYQKTLKKSKIIKEKGYNLIEIWEYDWTRFIRSVIILQRKWKNKSISKMKIKKKQVKIEPKLELIEDNKDIKSEELEVKTYKYNCEKCNYYTDNKSNYDRHLKSNRHNK